MDTLLQSMFIFDKKKAVTVESLPPKFHQRIFNMKPKVKQKNKVYIEGSNKKGALYLDTLEVTTDYFKTKSHETLYRRTITKHSTLQKITSIIDTINNPEIRKKYWRTYHCNRVLLQNQLEIQGGLCRKRWCTNCNRIKTAELMNGYKQPLLQMKDLYFVTLTAPTVKGSELKSEIKKRIIAFQKCQDNLRKTYNIKLNGMRKIEVTYNSKVNKYHPHFHLILGDLSHAKQLLSLWLKQYPKANIKAQDITKIDTSNESSFIELFKYATKETTKEGVLYPGDVLHTIYDSIEGFRIYQPFGDLRKIKPIKEQKHERLQIDFIEPMQEVWVYDSPQKDYLNSSGRYLLETQLIELQKQKKYVKT